MPKRGLSKSVATIKNDLYQAAKYHWEFKRRNEAYRLWWKQGAKAQVKPKEWDERFNPDVPFDELIRSAGETALHSFPDLKWKKILSENPNRSNILSALEFLFIKSILPKGVEEEFGPGWMRIKIDFNKIKNLSALREYVTIAIEGVYKLHLKAGLLSTEKDVDVGKSMNLNRDFDKIIEAGDLKRSGKTYAQIAKVLFPATIDRVTGEASQSAVREAKRYVKQYKSLTYKGYLGISFP